jgi:hypothetical protein
MKTIFTTVLCTAAIIGQISMASAQYEYGRWLLLLRLRPRRSAVRCNR